MTNLKRSEFQAHPFHLVSPSLWPLNCCIALLSLTTAGVSTMHSFISAYNLVFLALLSLILSMSFWFRDVISEGTYLGNHTLAVQRGLNMGVALFIVSEALFFLAIFWAYFHSALSPTIELGAHWPPMGIEAINPFELPLINTVILLSSGFTVTYAHHCLIEGNRSGALYGLVLTIILAIVFTAFQGVEYSVSFFNISDGTFGSCFYFGTGLILAPTKNSIYSFSLSLLATRQRYICNNNNINPNWVTGFCDAESTFSIRIGNDNTRFKSLRIAPIFSIKLHERDYALLEEIKYFFKVGTIIKRVKKGNPAAIYSVQSISALKDVIMPHFNKYKLLTQKNEDFRLFCLVVDMLYNGEHKNEKGLNKILSCKASMGKGLSKTLLNMFPNIKSTPRNLVLPAKKFNPFWVAGFVDGQGCFYVKTSKLKQSKCIVYKVSVYFYIAQHTRDISLLNNLITYLNCGLVETVKNRPTQCSYVVCKYEDIINKIIPFFKTYPLKGKKLLDFYNFKKIANLIENNTKYPENSEILKRIIIAQVRCVQLKRI